MKIDIIGQGNVGSHLVKALIDKCDVRGQSSRDLSNLRENSDLYILCVKDDMLKSVAQKVTMKIDKDTMIAHTSGSMSIAELEKLHKNVGVIYPLQTFTKNVPLCYSEIPFFIEANNAYNLRFLKNVANLISPNVKEADSEYRKRLHIASVFACNFVNHLWCLSERFLESYNMDFNDIKPLIKETTSKILHSSPFYAQTGPAVRNDLKTINSHIDHLSEETELLQIYKMITNSIIKNHAKNIGDSTPLLNNTTKL